MAYGLKVFDGFGAARLDTTDREFRYVALYNGILNASSSVTINVTGLSTDGTWGLNEQGNFGVGLSLTYTNGSFTITNASTDQRGWVVQVFRI